jgi:Uma2 family endonuclease
MVATTNPGTIDGMQEHFPDEPVEDVFAQPDERVFLHDVSWQDYQHLLRMRGDRSAPRIQYLDGEVEIMSPSIGHDGVKKRIARLFEAVVDELEIDANGYGSWTLRKAKKKRGVEPDECYVRGGKDKRLPDLAIEVIWTSGGLDKLELYRKLGVPELWIWKRPGKIQVYALRGDAYVRVRKSRIFPEVDLAIIDSLVPIENQSQAVRELRAILRGSRKG